MIRINLLPFRAARRKENVRRQVSIFILMIFLFSAVLYYYTTHVDKKIHRVRQNIASANSQIALYRDKAERVTKIKKDLDNLKKKLETISALQSKRRESVTLLDEMTDLILPGKMWLTSLKTYEARVEVKGLAYDNKIVADFMTSLERSFLFSNVDLRTLELKTFAKEFNLKAFELSCKKKPAAAKADQKGKK